MDEDSSSFIVDERVTSPILPAAARVLPVARSLKCSSRKKVIGTEEEEVVLLCCVVLVVLPLLVGGLTTFT